MTTSRPGHPAVPGATGAFGIPSGASALAGAGGAPGGFGTPGAVTPAPGTRAHTPGGTR